MDRLSQRQYASQRMLYWSFMSFICHVVLRLHRLTVLYECWSIGYSYVVIPVKTGIHIRNTHHARLKRSPLRFYYEITGFLRYIFSLAQPADTVYIRLCDVSLIFEPDVKVLRCARHLRHTDGDVYNVKQQP